MKSDDLKKILKVLIQEELRVQLPAMIPQVLTEILSGKQPTIVSAPKVQKTTKQYTSNPALNAILNETANNPTAVEKPKKQYSNNPTLNSILNETAMASTVDGKNIEQEMMEARLPSAPLYAMAMSGDEESGILNESITTRPAPAPANAPVIMKDYRKLMKAVDEKKKGGMIGSGMVGMV